MDKARIIVVGAGAAGLLAAGRAASLIREAGRQDEIEVVLLERMRQTGRKIRISGKGRCNLSNTLAADEFIKHFNRNGRFLRQALARFFTDDLLDLLHGLDLPTVAERGGRIFPASGSAVEVAETLEAWARGQGVKLVTGARVRGLDQLLEQPAEQPADQAADQPAEQPVAHIGGLHYDLFAEHGKAGSGGSRGSHEMAAAAIILATGGKSYPATGSTGDGYDLARDAGHTLIPAHPSLVPLRAGDTLPQGVTNLKLRNIEISLWVNGKRKAKHFGELHFTRTGLGGPVILEVSRVVVKALDSGKRIDLTLDLKPALDEKKLDARLIRDLEDGNHATWGDLLAGLVPAALIPAALKAGQLPADKPCHQITGPERRILRDWLKEWRFRITGFGNFDEAIVTAGGIDTREVDPRTMESRLMPGLYIMGELLDVDADTGGFNLMAAFSTGWVGGEAVARSLLTALEG